jgi:hypothetical protein
MRRQVAADDLRPPAEDRPGCGGQCPALGVKQAADRRRERLRIVPRRLGGKSRPCCGAA